MYDPIEAAARGIKMAIRANLMTLAAMFREIDGDSSGCVSLAEFEREQAAREQTAAAELETLAERRAQVHEK